MREMLNGLLNPRMITTRPRGETGISHPLASGGRERGVMGVIKERAKKSTVKGTKGEFVYGYYFVTHERPNRSEHWIIEDNNKKHLVYPETVGQYVGLKDKNKYENPEKIKP